MPTAAAGSKGGATGRPWFGQRDPDKIPAVIRTGSANVDFTGQLAGLENAKFPYDFLVLSWCLWDNCPLDADVPDAVKAWNEQYAYPRIIIAGGHEIMQRHRAEIRRPDCRSSAATSPNTGPTAWARPPGWSP